MFRRQYGEPSSHRPALTDSDSDRLSPDTSKTCLMCGGGIPVSASRCKYCGSFQNFRRYLDFGPSFFAVGIAIVSLGTLAFTNIVSALELEESDIEMRFQGFVGVDLKFLVVNEGARPGGLGVAILTIVSGESEREFRMETCCATDVDFIVADSAKQILFRPSIEYGDDNDEKMDALRQVVGGTIDNAFITIDIINFGSDDSVEVLAIPAGEFNLHLAVPDEDI